MMISIFLSPEYMEEYMDADFRYPAKVIDVYDGDTVTCMVNLGFSVIVKEKIRLFGINTPELRGAEKERGYVSRDRMRELVLDKDIILYTIKNRRNEDTKGKYGRYLGILVVDGVNANQTMLDENLAEVYDK